MPEIDRQGAERDRSKATPWSLPVAYIGVVGVLNHSFGGPQAARPASQRERVADVTPLHDGSIVSILGVAGRMPAPLLLRTTGQPALA